LVIAHLPPRIADLDVYVCQARRFIERLLEIKVYSRPAS
jgi:hypothetical protein